MSSFQWRCSRILTLFKPVVFFVFAIMRLIIVVFSTVFRSQHVRSASFVYNTVNFSRIKSLKCQHQTLLKILSVLACIFLFLRVERCSSSSIVTNYAKVIPRIFTTSLINMCFETTTLLSSPFRVEIYEKHVR